MIQEENDHVGFHRHFFRPYPCTGPDGTPRQVLYSPFVGDFWLDSDLPQSRGGLVLEDMGIGKISCSSLFESNSRKISFSILFFETRIS